MTSFLASSGRERLAQKTLWAQWAKSSENGTGLLQGGLNASLVCVIIVIIIVIFFIFYFKNAYLVCIIIIIIFEISAHPPQRGRGLV